MPFGGCVSPAAGAAGAFDLRNLRVSLSMSGATAFADLPEEVILLVFLLLPAPDLLAARLVARAWSRLASDRALWLDPRLASRVAVHRRRDGLTPPASLASIVGPRVHARVIHPCRTDFSTLMSLAARLVTLDLTPLAGGGDGDADIPGPGDGDAHGHAVGRRGPTHAAMPCAPYSPGAAGIAAILRLCVNLQALFLRNCGAGRGVLAALPASLRVLVVQHCDNIVPAELAACTLGGLVSVTIARCPSLRPGWLVSVAPLMPALAALHVGYTYVSDDDVAAVAGSCALLARFAVAYVSPMTSVAALERCPLLRSLHVVGLATADATTAEGARRVAARLQHLEWCCCRDVPLATVDALAAELAARATLVVCSCAYAAARHPVPPRARLVNHHAVAAPRPRIGCLVEGGAAETAHVLRAHVVFR